jgi:hypothetical protein
MTRLEHAARRGTRCCAVALGSIAVFFVTSTIALEADNASAASTESRQVKLLVLDIELLGDLSDPGLAAEHEARIRMASDTLRDALARTGLYEVVDRAPARTMIDTLSTVQYLHKCNGCEIDIALELDAEQVLVAWVHRVSNLILSLTYEIREVPDGTPIRRKAFDFRGDNDQGWSRAVTYMVKDLEERLKE